MGFIEGDTRSLYYSSYIRISLSWPLKTGTVTLFLLILAYS